MFTAVDSCAFEVLLVTRVDKSTYLDKQETVNAIRMLPVGTFVFRR